MVGGTVGSVVGVAVTRRSADSVATPGAVAQAASRDITPPAATSQRATVTLAQCTDAAARGSAAAGVHTEPLRVDEQIAARRSPRAGRRRSTAAIDRTLASPASSAAALGHVDAAFVVRDHQLDEQLVGRRAARRGELLELGLGRHAGHLGRVVAMPIHAIASSVSAASGWPMSRSIWIIRPISRF